MRRLSVKERWVLDYIRDNPGQTMSQISEASPVHIIKTEEWARWAAERELKGVDEREIPSVEYQQVQLVVRKLLDRGLIRREGERPYRHYFEEEAEIDPGDELEQLFAGKAWGE
jgi:hypothetical protein